MPATIVVAPGLLSPMCFGRRFSAVGERVKERVINYVTRVATVLHSQNFLFRDVLNYNILLAKFHKNESKNIYNLVLWIKNIMKLALESVERLGKLEIQDQGLKLAAFLVFRHWQGRSHEVFDFRFLRQTITTLAQLEAHQNYLDFFQFCKTGNFIGKPSNSFCQITLEKLIILPNFGKLFLQNTIQWKMIKIEQIFWEKHSVTCGF